MMSNLASTLIVNTVVFSGLVLLMLPLRRRLMTKISPALMLALWAVVALKLVIPFGFESRIGVVPSGEASASAPVSVTAQGTASATDMAMPETRSVQTKTYDNETTDGSAVQVSSDETVQTAPVAAAQTVDWTAVGLCLWAAGVLAAAVLFGLGAVGLKRRVHHACLPVPDRVHNILDECRAALGIRRNVRVVLQAATGSPVDIGCVAAGDSFAGRGGAAGGRGTAACDAA